MTINELKDQIQEDIIAFMDGMGDEVIADLCQIVVDRINQFQKEQQ